MPDPLLELPHTVKDAEATNFVTGLFNASTAYGRAERWEDLGAVLAALEKVAAQHGEQAEIVLAYAKGLFNASLASAWKNQWSLWQTVAANIAEMCRRLGSDHPHYPIAVDALGGCVWAAWSNGGASKMEDPECLVALVNMIIEAYPKLPEGEIKSRIGELLGFLSRDEERGGVEGQDGQ